MPEWGILCLSAADLLGGFFQVIFGNDGVAVKFRTGLVTADLSSPGPRGDPEEPSLMQMLLEEVDRTIKIGVYLRAL